jgi:hypothetical protein
MKVPSVRTTQSITLDGRKFHPINGPLTSAQDNYIVGHLRLAGAGEIVNDAGGKKTTLEERGEALVTRLLLSDQAQFIVAGCLIEEGKVWSGAEADRNAAAFAAITDLEEKTAMQQSFVRFIIAFLRCADPHATLQ